MPKVSKGKKARQNNLSKATEALTSKRYQTNTPIPEGTPSELDSPTQTFSELEPTSLDDTPGSWDSLLGDELPDVECTELQDENEDEEDMELNSETALASFAEFLVDAQAAAQKAERQLEQETGRNKKRKGYTGHSRQTAQRRKQAETKMREQGYSDIRSFFGNAGKAPMTASSSKEITEISSDSENDSASDSSTDAESVEIPIAPLSADVETFMDPVNLAHVHLKELLEAISHNSPPVDNSPESLAENKLNGDDLFMAKKRLSFFSMLEKIEMDILPTRNCCHMFHMQLTFLKPEWQTKYQEEQSVYFPSIMLLVIRSVQQMLSQPERCPRDQAKHGANHPECDQEHYLEELVRNSIILTIIQICLDGSRACSKFWKSGGCFIPAC
ncbi:hypothetical protein FB451DRAFT_1299152 [Mycena latifolia]|nr:hypothetical protein FB451DRAFT_1299152 [Mycena latifolia]